MWRYIGCELSSLSFHGLLSFRLSQFTPQAHRLSTPIDIQWRQGDVRRHRARGAGDALEGETPWDAAMPASGKQELKTAPWKCTALSEMSLKCAGPVPRCGHTDRRTQCRALGFGLRRGVERRRATTQAWRRTAARRNTASSTLPRTRRAKSRTCVRLHPGFLPLLAPRRLWRHGRRGWVEEGGGLVRSSPAWWVGLRA